MTEAGPLRIIVADDEAVIRMGLKTMLYALNHKVVETARDGKEAIEKVKRFSPDLLLLDIKMPAMDGLTAAEILAREAPLPIVMLTAYSQKSLIEKAVNAPVMGYLVKPIDEKKLGPTIDFAVARYKELKAKVAEVERLKKSLAGRTLVDRARERLIQQGLSEHQAYHYLQAAARKRQISLAEMAKRVLSHRRAP